jgi:hypothetical protein
MNKREEEAFLREYKAEEKRFQEFQIKAMSEIVRRQEGYEAKIQALIAASNKLTKTNQRLHIVLEEALNEIAARDILQLQETEDKKRNLSAKLQALRDNEADRNRHPDFKAGAVQPTNDGFLGYGRNLTLKETTRAEKISYPKWVSQDQSTPASLRPKKKRQQK